MGRAFQIPALIAAIVLACLWGAPGAQGAAPPPLATVTVSPQPGTPDASPATQISFLGASARTLGRLRVSASRSGRHGGRLAPYADGRGVSFLPARPFMAGERVRVSIHRGRATRAFSFGVSRPVSVPLPALSMHPTLRGRGLQHFFSRPDLLPPLLSISTASPAATHGDVFLAPLLGPTAPGRPHSEVGQPGPMLVDGKGKLLWFHPLKGALAMDFQAQTYASQPVLTWWQGRILALGFGRGEDVVYNSSYRQVARVRAGNGLMADLHEFVLTPQKTAWITAVAPVSRDLTAVHGPKRGVVLDSVVQEIDVRTGLVMFEWHSLGHVRLTESYMHASHSEPFDYFHVNSIDATAAGNLLISARNTWGVYYVKGQSGRVLWRLGGKRSSFRLTKGTHFAWQHDARFQPGGTISLFDDEGAPTVGYQSRGVVMALDQRHRTATLVRQYAHRPRLITGSQGNLQTLPGGGAFIGWGGLTNFTEFGPAGAAVFDGRLPAPDDSYRAYRLPWSGRPVVGPKLALRRAKAGRPTAFVSWNGATEVAAWELLAGPSPQTLVAVATAPRRGFETAIALPAPAPYVAVRALDSAGRRLGSSRALRR